MSPSLSGCVAKNSAAVVVAVNAARKLAETNRSAKGKFTIRTMANPDALVTRKIPHKATATTSNQRSPVACWNRPSSTTASPALEKAPRNCSARARGPRYHPTTTASRDTLPTKHSGVASHHARHGPDFVTARRRSTASSSAQGARKEAARVAKIERRRRSTIGIPSNEYYPDPHSIVRSALSAAYPISTLR